MPRFKTAPYREQPKQIQRGLSKATRRYRAGCYAVMVRGRVHYIPKTSTYVALKALGIRIISETIVLS